MRKLLVLALALSAGVFACTEDDPSGGGGFLDPGGSGGTTSACQPLTSNTQLAFDSIRISSQQSDEHFQQATTEIDLGCGPYASVKLLVELTSTCYPFEKWATNPPPQGQNWPADCDAFDRNFEFTIDPAVNPGDPPGIELVRAVTPFGGPLDLEIDLTDVANFLHGRHRLKVVIPTWPDGAGQISGSRGGWNVTARLEFTPGEAPREVLAVIPLWDGNLQRRSGPGPIPFEVPAGTTSSRLEFRATGHGGAEDDSRQLPSPCIGPAEEFCRREHTFLVDDAEVERRTFWRDDCQTLCTLTPGGPFGGNSYCAENPCGSPASVRAPRFNWCPGSLTPPHLVESPALSVPGRHTFSWRLDHVASGGIVRTSAVYFAFGS